MAASHGLLAFSAGLAVELVFIVIKEYSEGFLRKAA
jgi:hypothetical protein